MGGRFINTDPTPANLRALWDALHNLRTALTTAQADLTQHASTLTSIQSDLATTRRLATQAVIGAGSPVSSSGTGTAPSGGTVTDGGAGELGCSLAGVDGHVTDPASLETLGKICCGTGNEFPALLAVVVDQPTRDANRYELIGRMIWHINLNGGFDAASRYPGNLFDILVGLNGTQYAYRVTGYETFETPMTTVMVFGGLTVGAATTPDPGISD